MYIEENAIKKSGGIMAIPHKSARESDERFFVRKRWKTAGILCVFQGFPNEFLAEKIRQNPQTHLCGVALVDILSLLAALQGGRPFGDSIFRCTAKDRGERRAKGIAIPLNPLG